MKQEEINVFFALLKNKSRFYKIERETKIWFYDTWTRSLYTIEKDIYYEIENNTKTFLKIVDESSVTKLIGFLNFFKTVTSINNEPDVGQSKNSKCEVMINTSTRCNLNCRYCYRDKKKVKVSNIETVKQTIDYIIKQYRPNAEEYVFSYAMTSESSLDISLLKEILKEYVNYEDYRFSKEDFQKSDINEVFNTVDQRIIPFIKTNKCSPQEKTIESYICYLNEILKQRNLFDLLEIPITDFNDNDKNEIRRREVLADWRVVRLNRWILEKIFGNNIKNRKVPFVTFWFMTNGTNATPEFIDLVKSVDINPLWISIDGPRFIHDANRKYLSNNNGSFEDVLKNLKIFRQNGINLRASTVLTTVCPEPLMIINYLRSLNFTCITMAPVRPGSEVSFTLDNIDLLLRGYDKLFNELQTLALNKDFTLFKFLNEDLSLTGFYLFLERTFFVKRCCYDEQLVVNTEGNISQCLYFSENKDFFIGNIYDGIDENKINHNILIKDRIECNNCWAKYLCGGTCYYGSYIQNGNIMDIDPVECKLKKYLIEKGLELVIFFKENNIDFNNVIR